MTKSKYIIAAVAAAVSQLLSVQSGSAQPFYPAFVSTEGVSTNQAGNLVSQEFGNHELILAGASEQGITNLTGLSLVYDRTADALEVVSGTNNTLVSTPLTFATGVLLSNTNGTQIERFGGVYWGTNQNADGSLVAREQIIPATTNQPARFSLQGELQFVVSQGGTNPTTIYTGEVTTKTPGCYTGTSETNSFSYETNSSAYETNFVGNSKGKGKSKH